MFDPNDSSSSDYSNNYGTGADHVVPAESSYEWPSHSTSSDMYSSDSLYND